MDDQPTNRADAAPEGSEPGAAPAPPGSEPARATAGRPAVVGLVGKSGSGKTTLIEALIPALSGLGVRVATVKRTPRFDIDKPGKDSWRHGQAGTAAYVVASATQLAFVENAGTPGAEARPADAPRDSGGRPAQPEPRLSDIVARFFADIDLVLCEGYRREAPQVIEVFRQAAGYEHPVCAPGEALAVVTNAPLEHEHRFALDDAAGLAQFLVERFELAPPE